MRSGSEGERESRAPTKHSSGTNAMPEFREKRDRGGMLKRLRAETKHILAVQCLHPLPVRSLVRLHFQKLLARLFALCGGRGRRRTTQRLEDGSSERDPPIRSQSPRRHLALGCLHFGIDWARHSSQQTSAVVARVAVGEWNARRFQRIRGTHSTVTFPGPLESLFI